MRDYPPAAGADRFEISLSGGESDSGNSITFLNNGRPKDNNAGRAFKVIYTYGKGANPAKMESNFRVSPSGRIIAGELTTTSEDA